MTDKLKIGHINYLNCEPFFHYLQNKGCHGDIIQGVPAELNRLLAEGLIDVSISSSFEYGCRWRDYQLLPSLSISADGPVESVLLFYNGDLASLEGEEIALTGESATSIHLLQILLREYVGLKNNSFTVPHEPIEAIIRQGRPALLIGDRALRQAALSSYTGFYDLAALWKQYTGLPFVFALWICRRTISHAKQAMLAQLDQQLCRSYDEARSRYPQLAQEVSAPLWISSRRLERYWRTMSYRLDDKHLEGLQLFFRLSVKHGFLQEEPELQFVTI